MDEREIQHIHYAAVEELPISLAPRHQSSYFVGRTRGEDHAVKQAVDDIAKCTRRDERHDSDIAHLESATNDIMQIPAQQSHGYNAKQREEEFVKPFDAESHAVVLHKAELPPRENLHAFAQTEMQFYIYFDYLVNDQ